MINIFGESYNLEKTDEKVKYLLENEIIWKLISIANISPWHRRLSVYWFALKTHLSL